MRPTQPPSKENHGGRSGNGIKLEMLLIPAGEFMMGSPELRAKRSQVDEMPQHRVRITRPFYLGKYPVTQKHYKLVMGRNRRATSRIRRSAPVEMVSWRNAPGILRKAGICRKRKRRGEHTDYRPKQSGSTPAARGARRSILLVITTLCLTTMRGFITTRATQRTQWAKRSRTLGGCTTCTGTCGSGAKIGMVRMGRKRRATDPDLQRARIA